MTQRDERLYFAEMLSAIDRALEYTAGGREVFFTDPKTQDAVVRNIEIIGEAVRGVSDATRQAHPEVLQEIRPTPRPMRHGVSHSTSAA